MAEEQQPIRVSERRAMALIQSLITGLADGWISLVDEPDNVPGPGGRGRYLTFRFYEAPQSDERHPLDILPIGTDLSPNARAAAELGDRATYTPRDLDSPA